MDNRGYPGDSPYSDAPYGDAPDYRGDAPGYRGDAPGYRGDYPDYGDGRNQGFGAGEYAGYGHGYADGYPAPAGDPGRRPQTAGNGGSSTLLTVGIVTIVIVVLLLGAIGVGVLLRGDDGSAARADADRRPPANTGATDVEGGTAGSGEAPRPTPSRNTAPGASGTATANEDFGTGRADVDSRGWIGSYARCGSGDDVLAVLEVLDGDGNPMQTVACETPGGRMYYRGTGTAGDLEAPVTGDYGNRIIARNGEWEYEMTPSALNIRNASEDMSFLATTWGRA